MHVTSISPAPIPLPTPELQNSIAAHPSSSGQRKTAEQRRRRQLSVYHRALRSAKTPQQRAAVAARYRKVFANDDNAAAFDASGPVLAEPVDVPVSQPFAVRLAS